MKKEGKGYLIAAIVMGVLLIICLLILVTGKKGDIDSENTEEEAVDAQEEISPYKQEAIDEVARFLEAYGVEIPLEDMEKALQDRRAYEKLYGKSYDLEEIFLTNESEDITVGDETDQEMWDTLDLIDAYVEKYNIDETRFAGMSPEEELMAIQVEYGTLEDETDSAYYDGLDKKIEGTEDLPAGETDATESGGDGLESSGIKENGVQDEE